MRWTISIMKFISTGFCSRVSYYTISLAINIEGARVCGFHIRSIVGFYKQII